MNKQVTLSIKDSALSQLETAAAARSIPVEQLIGELVEREADALGKDELSTHELMKQIATRGAERHAGKLPSRDEVQDREYQRALTYIENRERLLKLIDETSAYMGKQPWNRSALYER